MRNVGDARPVTPGRRAGSLLKATMFATSSDELRAGWSVHCSRRGDSVREASELRWLEGTRRTRYSRRLSTRLLVRLCALGRRQTERTRRRVGQAWQAQVDLRHLRVDEAGRPSRLDPKVGYVPPSSSRRGGRVRRAVGNGEPCHINREHRVYTVVRAPRGALTSSMLIAPERSTFAFVRGTNTC